MFVGYPFGKKGWTIYDLDTVEFLVSRDVVFQEDQFPFKSCCVLVQDDTIHSSPSDSSADDDWLIQPGSSDWGSSDTLTPPAPVVTDIVSSTLAPSVVPTTDIVPPMDIVQPTDIVSSLPTPEVESATVTKNEATSDSSSEEDTTPVVTTSSDLDQEQDQELRRSGRQCFPSVRL
ncbi:hypothetical protein V5N11_030114 [Cardamine amara subsp. amara]|uniref:Retroviral polymerase SH3-like domain-containing protein n=1 Tax=Cardamine amara subsp. amara TaxID=228776 RepID=A0ABD0ZN29_CARAN